MFDNIDVTAELAATQPVVELNIVDKEHAGRLLIADAIQHMCKPVRPHDNPDVVEIRTIQRSLALAIHEGDGSIAANITELSNKYVDKVRSAMQADIEENIVLAETNAKAFASFIKQLFENVIRNGYFRWKECCLHETPVADSSRIYGIDGKVGAYQTKSSYSGWKRVSVEPDTMRDGIDEAGRILVVDNLVTLLFPVMDAWFIGHNTSTIKVGAPDENGNYQTRVVPAIRTGWSIDKSTGDVTDFFTVEEVWADLSKNANKAFVKATASGMLDAIGKSPKKAKLPTMKAKKVVK